MFLGATAGIGRSALFQFVAATLDKAPHVYIVGRSSTAFASDLAELKLSNSSAKIDFIERDVSLVKETDKAMEKVMKEEDKVDLLFAPVGYLAFRAGKVSASPLVPRIMR